MKRNAFLEIHVGWTGLGIGYAIGANGLAVAPASAAEPFAFVQISDSHIGFFIKPRIRIRNATLKDAIDRINALAVQPKFVIHTGDVTHLAKAAEFDPPRRGCCRGSKHRSSYCPANTT